MEFMMGLWNAGLVGFELVGAFTPPTACWWLPLELAKSQPRHRGKEIREATGSGPAGIRTLGMLVTPAEPKSQPFYVVHSNLASRSR